MRRALAILLALAVAATSAAERLPVTQWTVADGLPRDAVLSLFVDSRGTTWIATGEGIATVEGDGISTRAGEGLPDRRVREIAETRDGTLWVGTQGGLFRLRLDGQLEPDATHEQPWTDLGSLARRGPRWTACAPPPDATSRVITCVVAHDDEILCGLNHGMARVTASTSACPQLERVPLGDADAAFVQGILPGESGTWIATSSGAWLLRDGRAQRVSLGGRDDLDVRAMARDEDGETWIATHDGLFVAAGDPPRFSDPIGVADGLPSSDVRAVLAASDGTIWVATRSGLAERPPDSGRFIAHGAAEGLTDELVLCLAEDRAGNAWIGTEVSGLLRLARTGMSSFGRADGLAHPRIASLVLDSDGRLVAQDATGALDVLGGRRFRAVRPTTLDEDAVVPWGWNEVSFQDSHRTWWVPTRDGVAGWDGAASPDDLARRPPDRRISTSQGLPDPYVFRLHEEPDGDLLIVTFAQNERTLARWSRASGAVSVVPLPDLKGLGAPTVLRDGEDGSLWAGFYDGAIGRLRGGTWTMVRSPGEDDGDQARDAAFDASGRLWFAGESIGILRIDDPAADLPVVSQQWRAADGLASDDVSCITELEPGVMAIGTSRGLDLLDVSRGRVRRYGVAEGLPNGYVNVELRDRDGVLWLGTLDGVARLVRPHPHPVPPPTIRLTEIRVDGVSLPVSLAGESGIKDLVLRPGPHQIELRAGAAAHAPGESLRFATAIDGAGWSDPRTEPSLTLASLAPGRHSVRITAMGEDGRTSTQPADLAFLILRPPWQRPWFLALVVLAIAAAAAVTLRARVLRLLELERVRTRIATDLHDDIGASLTQVAILSEVARRRVGSGKDAAEALGRIGDVTRELVDSMSDIVWAIDPRRDTLADLVQRMRRLAEDLTEERGVALGFEVAADADAQAMGADVRRQTQLVFKEALHNAARHSGCTRVDVRLQADRSGVRLEVKDDGSGFDRTEVGLGHGLTSMRRRAEELGGRLDVESAPGHGTTIRLMMPLRPKRRTT